MDGKAMTRVGALHDQLLAMLLVPNVSQAATIEPMYQVVLYMVVKMARC